LAFAPALLLILSCGGDKGLSDAEKMRAQFCPPAQSAKVFEETPFKGGVAKILSFQNIRANVNAACASCHRAPANKGAFMYLDEWKGKVDSVNGKTEWYPGFFEVAEKMREYIEHPDMSKRMPPEEYRAKNPESFLEIGRQLGHWITAGKIDSTFEAGKVPVEREGKYRPVKPRTTSELGDCVPTAKAIGSDYKADMYFEKTKVLPKYLMDTDMFTLDPYLLASHGTVAYNVEYPLWADNAEKGRWIHIPMKMEDGQLKKQSIEYDGINQKFIIPENTRFYKSFYRPVLLANKKIKMRRMETRIIVTRTPWEKSLFGTYQWDESEQVATLIEAPYRDGTPFRDIVVDVLVDEAKEIKKPYLIPGRERCLDCHRGSSMQNFILGFTPLQINKRGLDDGGRDEAVRVDDLNQVQRFIEYGYLKNVSSAAELPRLEDQGVAKPRNVYEMRANGYAVGNCFHCHNEKGLAMNAENQVELRLAPGDLFGFKTTFKSKQFKNRSFVHFKGDLDGSHIWRKVADKDHGMFSRMPMHTPGSPDCRVLKVMGKWIRSFESEQAASEFTPSCKKENELGMIDLDMTWPVFDKYTPRRDDWADAAGMPLKFRNIQLSPTLKNTITNEYAVGHWLKKPECSFPTVTLPADKQRPWMLNPNGTPKKPFGEVYYTTPGSYFYRDTCFKCHGTHADGKSALATGIALWSGGKVRVANFMDDKIGMFGDRNNNLKTFDLNGSNYAGQYLIWMAMEGTRVKFPPELGSALGKHGGQMLNGIREKCNNLIRGRSSARYPEFEIFNSVCFMENLQPGHPDLAIDPNTDKPVYPERVEEWLDRAAYNAGWAIFEFLKEAANGNWLPSVDQCEKKFPATTRGLGQ